MSIMALSAFIQAKMDSRGWSQSDLADASGIPRSTLNNIMKKKVEFLEISTYVKLGQALGVSIRTLLEVSGIPVDPVPERTALQQQITTFMDAMPWLAPVLQHLIMLPDHDQAAVLAYLSVLQQQRSKER